MDEEALKHLPVVLEGGKPERYSDKYGGIDDFNAIMTVKRSHLSLAEVLKMHDDVHAELVEYVRNADSPLMSRVAIEFRANQKAWDLFHTTTVNKLPPQMLAQFEVSEIKSIAPEASAILRKCW